MLHLKLLNTDILGKALTDIQHTTCSFGTGTSTCTIGPSQKLEGGSDTMLHHRFSKIQYRYLHS